MPTSYLEDYFALGYECYYIENDKRVKFQKKVDIILSLFKDLILFFNIDFHIPDFEWEYYIQDLVIDQKYKIQSAFFIPNVQQKKIRLVLKKNIFMSLEYAVAVHNLNIRKSRILN